MRISDWSSDVCSSDLEEVLRACFGSIGRDVQEEIVEAIRRSARAGLGGPDERVADSVEVERVATLGNAGHCASISCVGRCGCEEGGGGRSEEHTSELQSLMRSSYAVFCWKKK